MAKARANLDALTVLRRLDDEQRPATAAEQALLARWAGWGALPQVFDVERPEWAAIRDTLAGLLSPAEYTAARASTINAHYTSADVVQAVWRLVAGLGFRAGRVLEPGCGSGNFFGFAPPDAQLVGVEVEPVTARIAQLLYPDAQIRAEGFERSRFPPGSFDLVVGNVPFGKVALYDPVHNRGRHSIHNHFLIKAVDLTRPGGLIALLTSHFTLDAADPAARRELAAAADLLGAVRLPSNTFAAAAGTSVVADLLVLRRRPAGDPPSPVGWERSAPVELPGGQVTVNEYFTDRPEQILGRPEVGSGLYGRELLISPSHVALVEALHAAGDRLGREAVRTRALPARPPADPAREFTTRTFRRPDGSIVTLDDTWEEGGAVHGYDPSAPGASWTVYLDESVELPGPDLAPGGPAVAVKEGAFLLGPGSAVFRKVDGQPVACPAKPQRDLPELRELIGLRDALTDLLALQAADADEQALAAAQRLLNDRYDRYRDGYGPLNRFTSYDVPADPATGEPRTRRRYPSMGGFRADPDVHSVLALEVFDADTGVARKAAVFTRRVIAPRSPAQAADTAEGALALCLDERGRVDVDRIAELLGVSAGDALDRLGERVYDDPTSRRWETAAEYLSGDVRAKLVAARAAADSDPDGYAHNVTALEAVQPVDLTPGEIDGQLGAPWIPPGDVAGFARELLGDVDVVVEHAAITASWAVGAPSYARTSVAATSTWGTARADAVALLESSLNQRPHTVYDPLPDSDRRVVNPTETLLARDKQDQIAVRFADWLWEDPERADRLAADYNVRFNSVVPTRFDGSHLTLPGLAATWTMRPHQADAIWRIVADGGALLAHVVGAGKTATMVAAGMEQRRLGLVAKPAYVVPNHMLEQFTREFLQLYPAARVLVASPADASKDGRKAFVARCATGDWDAVVLTHSAFARLPVSAQIRAGYLEQLLERFRAARDAQQAAGGRRTVKQLETEIARLSARHETLLAEHRKDDGIGFEQTGIDYLFVDEAHAYKNLAFPTRIQGVGGQGSQRAEDLAMKLRWLAGRHGTRVATFATGTPIANSVAEMFVMQSYLQPAALAARGIDQFDGWAATFGTTVTAMELAPDGGRYRMTTRFARFRNVPELSVLFRQVADVQTADTLQLPTPRIVGGKAQTVVVPPSAGLTRYVEQLVARADAVRNRAVDPDEDNMLKVTGDGRRAALDLRLVGEPPDPDGGKIAELARRAAAIYTANRARRYLDVDGQPAPLPGALQLVFCDLGTPTAGSWSVYQEVRDALAAEGVPADQVRFIHDAATDTAKARLFADCRAGKVAVLLGSTQKMGVGTNVQARLVALHHLDAPWRPADIEQREGRILRQGNQNPEVEILRYVTEGSFDVYMWQTLERKAAFIGQVMTGGTTAREIDDISDTALSFAEVKALATGNPLVLEKADVDTQVARLSRLRAAHERERARLRFTQADLLRRADRLDDRAALLDATAAGRHDTRGDRFAMTVGRARLHDRATAGAGLRDRLVAAARAAEQTDRDVAEPIGDLGGYPLQAHASRFRQAKVAVVFDCPAQLTVEFDRAELPRMDPRGLVQRLENCLSRAAELAADARRSADTSRAEAALAAERQQLPFPHADRLSALQTRQQHIEQALTPDQPPTTDTSLTGRSLST